MITYYPTHIDPEILSKMRDYIMAQALGQQVKLPIQDGKISVWSMGRRKYIVNGNWEETEERIYVGNSPNYQTPEWAVSALFALVDCCGLRDDAELISQICKFRDDILARKAEAVPRGVAESHGGKVVYQIAVNLNKNLVAGRYEEGGPYRLFSGEVINHKEEGWVELQQ